MKNEWLDELNTLYVSKDSEKLEIEDCQWVEKINIGNELTREKTNQLHNLLEKYKTVFQLNDNDDGYAKITEQSIDTEDNRIRDNMYCRRLLKKRSPNKWLQWKKQVKSKKLIVLGVAQFWLFRRNHKISQFRFILDFRNVKQVRIKDSYPLPRINDIWDALAGAYNFSTLDLAQGYLQ